MNKPDWGWFKLLATMSVAGLLLCFVGGFTGNSALLFVVSAIAGGCAVVEYGDIRRGERG